MANPFKTPEFWALFTKWNGILEKDGLKDVEDFSLPEPALKSWHSLKWQNAEEMEQTQSYYDAAQTLVETFPFKDETHRMVWELHCQGLTVRKIAEVVKLRRFTKTRVHMIILTVQREAGLKK